MPTFAPQRWWPRRSEAASDEVATALGTGLPNAAEDISERFLRLSHSVARVHVTCREAFGFAWNITGQAICNKAADDVTGARRSGIVPLLVRQTRGGTIPARLICGNKRPLYTKTSASIQSFNSSPMCAWLYRIFQSFGQKFQGLIELSSCSRNTQSFLVINCLKASLCNGVPNSMLLLANGRVRTLFLVQSCGFH